MPLPARMVLLGWSVGQELMWAAKAKAELLGRGQPARADTPAASVPSADHPESVRHLVFRPIGDV